MDASPQHLDDATLVARARDGDIPSFEVLLRRHQPSMYALAVRMLANRAEAEDVVQEVFLAAWRRLPEIRVEAAIGVWLYRSTTNRCLNRLRRAAHTAPLTDPDTCAAAGADQPDRVTETHAQLEQLSRALQRLTPEQRASWLLREVHGLPYADIATVLHTSSTAVRGRIARARAQLAEEMQPWR